MPSGGTSDYAPEMIHAAAQGEPYGCFVRPDTRIPFMAMPDGIEALLQLAAAPRAAPDAHGLQRRARSTRRPTRSATSCCARFPSADLTYQRRREAPGHRRLLAGRRGRLGRAPRLGLRAALRLRPRLRRLSDPDHPRALRPHAGTPAAAPTASRRRRPPPSFTGTELPFAGKQRARAWSRPRSVYREDGTPCRATPCRSSEQPGGADGRAPAASALSLLGLLGATSAALAAVC